jgi:hypothetical protein
VSAWWTIALAICLACSLRIITKECSPASILPQDDRAFLVKKDADARHAQIKVEIVQGKHVAPSDSIKVAAAAEHWLKSAEQAGLERATVEFYGQFVRRHIIPYLGAVRLAKITAGMVRSFQDRLHDDGRSQNTIKIATRILGSIIRRSHGTRLRRSQCRSIYSSDTQSRQHHRSV